MKIALRILWNEIGVWGIFILLSMTMLSGANPYHELYTSLFLLCAYLLVVFQVRKANAAILQQMRFLPDYPTQFLRIALILAIPITLFLGLLFFALNDVVSIEECLVIFHLFCFTIMAIYAMIYPIRQNYLPALFCGALLFVASPVINVAVILASVGFLLLGRKIASGEMLNFTRSVSSLSSDYAVVDIGAKSYIRQFLRLTFQRIDDVRANALFGIAFLWIPFVYALHSLLRNNDAAVFSFFVFGLCAVLTALFAAALLISQDLLEQLTYTGRLRDYYKQLAIPVFGILLLFSSILCVVTAFAVDNLSWLDIGTSLLSGLLFLDAMMIHLCQSTMRKRYMPLWLLYSIILLLSASNQQLFLVLPVFIGMRIWDSYPRLKEIASVTN